VTDKKVQVLADRLTEQLSTITTTLLAINKNLDSLVKIESTRQELLLANLKAREERLKQSPPIP